MPLPQISLSKKIIVLLAIPAAVQLGIVVGISALEYEMQVEADKADQARQVHDSIGQLVDIYRAMAATETKTLVSMGLGTPLFVQEQSKIYTLFAQLKELLGNNPKDLAVVQASQKSSLQAMAILQQLKEMQDQGNIRDHAESRPLLMHLRHSVQEIISPDLVDLANRESAIVDHVPVVQRRMRDQARWFIGLGGLISILATVVLAIFLLRLVALRLQRILDNMESFARHSTLPKSANSTDLDEIARLDQSFHEMAKTIDEITAKQMSVVDNAGDMICSIDADGTITSANAAAGKLFGCHRAELIGKSYRDLVHRKDAGLLSNYLQLARADAPGKPVQLRLNGRGQRKLWVLWSAQWIGSENQYFSVVHDLTQIQEAQRMKQEVVSIVTHDLRTPLGNLQGFLDLLEEGSIARVEERSRRFITSARRNANLMLMLINDMIDLEKAKSGMLGLRTDQLYLDDIIDQAQVIIGPFAEEKAVVLDCRRSGLVVKGEEDKLMRVFTNLLGNAVQFAPRETSVLVVSKSQDGFAQVSISDKGPGIPPDQIGTIFDAFSQPAGPDGIENSTDKAADPSQGSSLGLAISKAFVELHGGSISAASKVGEGTTIALTLPLSAT